MSPCRLDIIITKQFGTYKEKGYKQCDTYTMNQGSTTTKLNLYNKYKYQRKNIRVTESLKLLVGLVSIIHNLHQLLNWTGVSILFIPGERVNKRRMKR